MCCRKDELQPGAYMKDTTTYKLYEVAGEPGRETKLIDVASPIDDPTTVEFLTVNALKRLELVQPAPSLEGVASVEEWGSGDNIGGP
jgi:hypothetical protein